MSSGTNFPSWLTARLANAVSRDQSRYNSAVALSTSGIRYESSLYGPLDRLLHHIFSMDAQFIIKPQSKLRPLLPNEPVAPSTQERRTASKHTPTFSITSVTSTSTDASTESHGGRTKSRKKGGREDGILEPDFLVTSATEDLRCDTIVCIVEVKRDSSTLVKSQTQIASYLTASAARKCVPDLRGFLVLREKTEEWRLGPEGQLAWQVLNNDGTPLIYETSGEPLRKRLIEIAGSPIASELRVKEDEGLVDEDMLFESDEEVEDMNDLLHIHVEGDTDMAEG